MDTACQASGFDESNSKPVEISPSSDITASALHSIILKFSTSLTQDTPDSTFQKRYPFTAGQQAQLQIPPLKGECR